MGHRISNSCKNSTKPNRQYEEISKRRIWTTANVEMVEEVAAAQIPHPKYLRWQRSLEWNTGLWQSKFNSWPSRGRAVWNQQKKGRRRESGAFK